MTDQEFDRHGELQNASIEEVMVPRELLERVILTLPIASLAEALDVCVDTSIKRERTLERELAEAREQIHAAGCCGAWGTCGNTCRAIKRIPERFLAAVRKLVIAGRTTGGTAGRDEGLCEALDGVEALLPPHPSHRT